MGSCGVSCVKYLVFVFNLLFALTGLSIVTVGSWVQSVYYHYATFVGNSLWLAPILLIIVGVVVFVIAFLGCCGAVKENSCMVFTDCKEQFSVLLVLIFLCEIGIGIAGYIKHGQLKDILEQGFNKTLTDYNQNEHAWKLIQSEMVCCGINGPADYEQVFHNETLPKSCCREFPVNQDYCTQELAIKEGCMSKLLHFLESNSLILAGVGIGIALIQLIGVCYACCLYRAFRKNYETV